MIEYSCKSCSLSHDECQCGHEEASKVIPKKLCASCAAGHEGCSCKGKSKIEKILDELKPKENSPTGGISSLLSVDFKPKKPKQVILVRTDINMGPGKIASQVAHASMKVFFDRAKTDEMSKFGLIPHGDLVIPMTPEMWAWKQGEFTKVVLEVTSEEQMLIMFAKATAAGIPSAIIQDNGHTVFNGVKTYTTCAIGPADPEEINAITGKLRLLK